MAKRPWRLIGQNCDERIAIDATGTLDEVVAEQLLHVERLDKDHYWVRIGDLKIEVFVRNGRATHV